MGVLNITPDSFYENSRVSSEEPLIRAIEKMRLDGARYIDIGAQSTRPGAKKIGASDEIERLSNFDFKRIVSLFPDLKFSIDTYFLEVAELMLESGFHMVNDISFLNEPEMLRLCLKYEAEYVLMHLRNFEDNYHNLTDYTDMTKEVSGEFRAKLELVEKFGLSKDKLYLDPGFGFSKSPEQNWELMRSFPSIKKELGEYMFLVGISRKSMFKKLFPQSEAFSQARYDASTVLAFDLFSKGLELIRTHDVASARSALMVGAELGYLAD